MASDLTDLLTMAASSANIMQQEYTPTFQPAQQQQYSTPQYSTQQYSTQQQQQQYQQQDYQQYKACENHKLLAAILQELTTLSRSMVKQEMNLQKELGHTKDGTSFQQKYGKGMRVENIHGTDDHPCSTSARNNGAESRC